MDADNILKRYGVLKGIREGYWECLWKEVRKYVYPTYSKEKSEGGSRGEELCDTTAIEARKRLAAGIFNWMAPQNMRWFDLSSRDEDIKNLEEVKQYFSVVTKRIMEALANSNWATCLIMALNDLAAGLDGVIYIADGGRKSLNFRCFPIETICYAENARSEIDTCFREYEDTARNLVEEFGESELPEIVVDQAKDPKRMDTKNRILHAVFPRTGRDAGKIDKKNKRFADVYIHMERRKVIQEGGYDEFPFAICRFEKAENETFGRGPGVDKLPDIKMLNRECEVYKLVLEHKADPGWMIPDGSIVNAKTFDRSPGKLHFYKAEPNGQKPEPVQLHNDIASLAQDIELDRERIKQGFFWDIFDPLGDLKNITATEAEIREGGKLVPFAPIAGNLHSELFRVVIHRCFAILSRRGELPDPPPELMEHPDYDVVFVSKIALALRKLDTLNWLQTEQAIAGLIQMNPELMDNYNGDVIVRAIGEGNGLPSNWTRTEEERDALRQQRQQTMQAQQTAAMMTEAAKAVPGAAKAPEPGSPLEALMNGTGV